MATLEELEGEVWPEPAPEEATSLVRKCHRLRKKEIEAFTTEDIRILVGQGIGLRHLTPLALAILQKESLSQGEFYPGDLLKALTWESNWKAVEPWASRIESVCREAIARLPADPPDIEINGKHYRGPERDLADHLRAYLNRQPHTH